MAISTPQQQAGVLSFYDAPERGPQLSARFVLIVVAVFVALIIIFDHASLFA
ncbi:MAG: hypothetical protein KGH64_02550 [Candidatus Micrarchaeota archaeon]|nr:hypothetical protein [Candidatus Micrarchaeota archaeon]MDE1859409.1 hypothetical protein [Candidatus Micrarchaeota archaeon]